VPRQVQPAFQPGATSDRAAASAREIGHLGGDRGMPEGQHLFEHRARLRLQTGHDHADAQLVRAVEESAQRADPRGIHQRHQAHAQDEHLGRAEELVEHLVEPVGDCEEQRTGDLEGLHAGRQLRAHRRSRRQAHILVVVVGTAMLVDRDHLGHAVPDRGQRDGTTQLRMLNGRRSRPLHVSTASAFGSRARCPDGAHAMLRLSPASAICSHRLCPCQTSRSSTNSRPSSHAANTGANTLVLQRTECSHGHRRGGGRQIEHHQLSKRGRPVGADLDVDDVPDSRLESSVDHRRQCPNHCARCRRHLTRSKPKTLPVRQRRA
jgi:hypothetical protein